MGMMAFWEGGIELSGGSTTTYGIAFGNIDGDGRTDIVVANSEGD